MAIVPDVSHIIGANEYAALTKLVERLNAKKKRNRIRQHYYDGTNALKDLQISIPPRLRDVEVAMGWPSKAVDTLSRLVHLEEFVLPGGDIADFGIDEIYRDNRLGIEIPMAQTSSLIHAVAFVLTYLGNPEIGEPEVVISPLDAQHATGLWLPTTRRLGAALAIYGEDEGTNEPTRMLLIFPHRVHSIWRESPYSPKWYVRTVPNTLGRVPMEPVVYRPRLDRPFGSSRISRAVMNITDSAMRTVIRSEVGAEFFSAPQRYLLGADEEMFRTADGSLATTWDLVMGRLLAIPRDEEFGEVPVVGQFPQISMQPHGDHLNMWARLFSGETGIPVDELGIIHDNPSSAEARYAARQSLIIEAEAAARGFAPAWVNSMKTAVQLRENLPEVPDALRDLDVRYRDPSTPSRASAVDAVVKEIQAGLVPADSEVALERAGYSETEIKRIVADRRRSAGRQALDAILARTTAAQRPVEGPQTPDQGSEVGEAG